MRPRSYAASLLITLLASIAPSVSAQTLHLLSLKQHITTLYRRPGQPAADIAFAGYDLGGRPAQETVGTRSPMAWQYDVFNHPVHLSLPAPSGIAGFERTFTTLDQLQRINGLTTSGSAIASLGASWTWSGSRLYEIKSHGALGTVTRFGYIGGAGPQIQGASPDPTAKWRLGTLTIGSAGTTSATALPENTWGQLGYGWRTGEPNNPQDGLKIGRAVLRPQPSAQGSGQRAEGSGTTTSTGWVGDSAPSPQPRVGGGGTPSLFAGMGWSWTADAGLRLSYAAAGLGSLNGEASSNAVTARYAYTYGKADELERIIHETAGSIASLETGINGRITSRNGAPFTYDAVGRRSEDDRFIYQWDWRGRLSVVTVKPQWPGANQNDPPIVPVFANHQIRYTYDAMGRLLHRLHSGPLPDGDSDDAHRSFIEKREYLWEGSSLIAEAAYGNPEQTLLRWRKTYIPGPTGLDDAVQVRVENFDPPGAPEPATDTIYTILRDEMGTVIGLVEEKPGADPANPPIPARYIYTPYGEAHAETGPELKRAELDQGLTSIITSTETITQTVTDPATTLAGGFRITVSLPIIATTIPSGLTFEKKNAEGSFDLVPETDRYIGPNPTQSEQILILPLTGWERNATYRIRLTTALKDSQDRSIQHNESLTFDIPPQGNLGGIFAKTWPTNFDSAQAAWNTVGGRFPGGQTLGFQGLWIDPVVGISYARARWYSARDASWLSEDPVGAVDSVNLYAFVGMKPWMGRDPMGLRDPNKQDQQKLAELQASTEKFKKQWSEHGVAYTQVYRTEYSEGKNWWDTEDLGSYEVTWETEKASTSEDFNRLVGLLERYHDSYSKAVARADEDGIIGFYPEQGGYLTKNREDNDREAPWHLAANTFVIAETFLSACGARGSGSLDAPKPASMGRRVTRAGRPGNPDHIADVLRNNAQVTGPLQPGKVGDRVPDGIGKAGQMVNIRGVAIDPGQNGRAIVESERFRQSGQMVGKGRDQIRGIRAADPNATIVVTDPANTSAPPVIYRPGTQPPPKGRLPKGAPTHVPSGG